MTAQDPAGKSIRPSARSAKDEARRSTEEETVLQCERVDFTDLVPTDRPISQGMRGFDPIYTDIVDYIVRCTHRIWDERDVGLIYTHYTHNAVIYSSTGIAYNREDVVRGTIQRIAELPDRRGQATQVIWRGNDEEGFYTSHLVTGTGRHTEHGPFGAPTGRSFVARTIADCLVFENRIYREWLVRDNMALMKQLGVDPHAFAQAIAVDQFAKGFRHEDVAENSRALGQYPPEEKADLSIAHTDTERSVLTWMHEAYNKRMFGILREVYAPNVQWHGPLMRELYGVHAITTQTFKLFAMMPDAIFIPQHICSVKCAEGGEKVAIRWIMDGHHLGHGALGAPTGCRLFLMGMTHLHIINGKVVDEWLVYDELQLLIQIKLAALRG